MTPQPMRKPLSPKTMPAMTRRAMTSSTMAPVAPDEPLPLPESASRAMMRPLSSGMSSQATR